MPFFSFYFFATLGTNTYDTTNVTILSTVNCCKAEWNKNWILEILYEGRAIFFFLFFRDTWNKHMCRWTTWLTQREYLALAFSLSLSLSLSVYRPRRTALQILWFVAQMAPIGKEAKFPWYSAWCSSLRRERERERDRKRKKLKCIVLAYYIRLRHIQGFTFAKKTRGKGDWLRDEIEWVSWESAMNYIEK